MAFNFPASPTLNQTVTVDGVTYRYNGYAWVPALVAAPFPAMSYTGIQVNGSFEVSQEMGDSPSAANKYGCDCWWLGKVGTMTVDQIRNISSIVPGFPAVFSGVLQVAQPSLAAGDFIYVRQPIEGWRIARLAWGTASAQPITIGFWTAHDLPGLYSGAVRNAAGNRAYLFTYTQAVGAQYNTVTVPGCTDGTWPQDTAGMGMEFSFCLASGSTSIAPSANTWLTGGYIAAPGQVNGAAATVGATFRFTGFTMFPGNAGPSAAQSRLAMRPYQEELEACQRYYWKGNVSAGGSGWLAAPEVGAVCNFPVTMRGTPTLAMSGGNPVGVTNLTIDNGSPHGFRIHGVANNAQPWYADNYTVVADIRF